MGSFVGIDLAWSARNRTGVAMVDEAGRLMESAAVVTDDQIAAWLATHAPSPSVVAIDAPIVVPNLTGHRDCERAISRAYGRFKCSAHAANRSIPWFDPPRAETLAGRFGWTPDPARAGSPRRPVCLEVYPHAAMVALFDLAERIPYKYRPGRDRAPGFALLVELVEGIEPLGLGENPRWGELRDAALRPDRGDWARTEDELDAILCAHLAWLWHHHRDRLLIYGTATDGFIVAPPPPPPTRSGSGLAPDTVSAG